MNYKRIVITLANWGHDLNGNPVARHTVRAYASLDDALTAPTATLYTSTRRQQTGTSSLRDDWTGSALRLAGLSPDLKMTRTVGGRDSHDGIMYLIYDVPQGVSK